VVHQACFHNKIKKGNPSVMVSSEEQKYFSKACFKKIESFVKRYEHSSLNWNEDAINPDKNGTESSIAVLLQWWCTEGNWATYRGKGNDGATKIQHCQGIADIINKTVIFPRTAKGVRCKIDKIHEKFKQALLIFDPNNMQSANVARSLPSRTFNPMKICAVLEPNRI